MSQLIAWMLNPVPASELAKSKAMCARPVAAPPPPPLPRLGVNVSLSLQGGWPVAQLCVTSSLCMLRWLFVATFL